ncbi:CidA/LrgA family protein [Falsirhodobacter deserti]|uniref:CidA/LrgA family protein n=1 Tax=Falsirhodobacter deserti TaxID=1365611 RepID=UPI000FE2C72F|nr:CidA/LrgA family protein [Falsirhodobacter deserti]
MIPPFLLLLGCQLAGEVLARVSQLPLPGPVIGMLLMLGLLVTSPRTEAMMRPVIAVFLANLSLLFVPAGAGVVAFLGQLRAEGLALAVTLVGSTVAALLAGAFAFLAVARLTGNRASE